MYRQILVGYVDSEQGRDAMALGRILAQASNAQIMVATVLDEDGDDLAALARAREADLIEAVDVGVDLLVLGSRAGGPVRRKIHHSVTRAVMERAACPVRSRQAASRHQKWLWHRAGWLLYSQRCLS